MTYTVRAFDYDAAPHHCNDLLADTVDSFKAAYELARQRTRETAQNTGYAVVVDNGIMGRMGDNGVVASFVKTKTGLRRRMLRDQYKKLLYTCRYTSAGLLALRNPVLKVWEYYRMVGPLEVNLQQTGSTLAFEP